MGNGCSCKSGIFMRDINLDTFSNKPIENTKYEQIKEKKLDVLMNYFNENEKKNEKDNKMRKSDRSKNLRKISKKNFNTIINNQHYEIMLKRLLDQKIINRFGPKRRQTIRKEEDMQNINNLVKEILQENKDDIHKLINHQSSDNISSLLIKNDSFKNNMSLLFDRNGIITNIVNKKNNNIEDLLNNDNNPKE
jgi:hypothetical protein